jgi:hypothetical protein
MLRCCALQISDLSAFDHVASEVVEANGEKWIFSGDGFSL